MENTLENKAKFFAQYYGQQILCFKGETSSHKYMIVSDNGKTLGLPQQYLELTPLHLISDEDAIEVAKLCYPENKEFTVDRREGDYFLIHINTVPDNINLVKQISLNKYCAINANWHFGEFDGEKPKSFKVNLAEKISYKYAIPMYAVTDYLRSKGYALPFNGLSVEEQVSRGWVKLRTEI